MFIGRGKFRGRPGANRRPGSSSPSSTTASPEVAIAIAAKPANRFSPPGRNGFGGRNRVNPRTTTTTEANGEAAIVKSEAALVKSSQVRNTFKSFQDIHPART